MSNEKTVYILGAGFSKLAGAPSQEQLFGKILELNPDTPRINRHKQNLLQFLGKTLGIAEKNITNLALEDIYTPIDRCLADQISLRGVNQSCLMRVRSSLDYLIARVIKEDLDSSHNSKDYVNQFAKHLVQLASRRSELAQGAVNADKAKAWDPFAIISLNWDILLDAAIHRTLEVQDSAVPKGDYEPFGVVDYCCYVSSYNKAERRIRSGLWSLGARGYNVKLLKPHGSLNWLQCENCQRLFTAFDEKIVVSEKINTPCRYCEKHGIKAKLRGTLIMPTFLKDFSNFQLKLVWQNVGVEIMEARRLVFIGYSLPQADFEFKQLIRRMLHPDASVHAVLWEGTEDKEKQGYANEKKRYADFFTGHKLSFEPEGVKAFVDQL